jgi:hypothetical protein
LIAVLFVNLFSYMRIVLCFALHCLLLSCIALTGNPDPGDDPLDRCDCPSGDLLAEHFVHESLTRTMRSDSGISQGMACDAFPDWLAVGGGCWHEPFAYNISINKLGLDTDSVSAYSWYCRWYNQSWLDVTVIASVRCVDPVGSRDAPTDCNCPPVHAFRDRLYGVHRSAPLVPEQPDNTLVVTCEPGDVLLTGGCTASSDVHPLDVKLSSAGFDLEDPDSWKCVWNHTGGPAAGTMKATIMCMRPPDEIYTPETEPLANRVVRRSNSLYLNTTTGSTDRVACSSEEFLLGGSCMLDNSDPSSYQSLLNLSAEDRFDLPNAWRCGWYEPTDSVTIQATTTAICLRPPLPAVSR